MAVSPTKPAAARGPKAPPKPPKARSSGQSSSAVDQRSRDQDNAKTADLSHDRAPAGQILTTNQGLKVADDQNSLKASVRGPTLLEDFALREKITHFDHERIPERVVHARGVGAHGVFKVYEDLSDLTSAGFLTDPGRETPVFVRFSTVAGSRGSADTPRDVRGFAVKFYTEVGVFDIVGNNIPVFFIQDAIKFPDLIHAVKPEPNNEIPQAASAHDTFYDFISLTPESAHMLMWVMSDRALPRSLSMMEGFGIHTFRLINAEGKSRFIKWHWKPVKGVHSLVWDESQKIAGKDADFHRRDLFEAIERGDYPQFELGIQVIEEEMSSSSISTSSTRPRSFRRISSPVRRIGLMTLNRNPDNYFAETEQVAFCLCHIVPGIDFSNDPLLQGRLFSTSTPSSSGSDRTSPSSRSTGRCAPFRTTNATVRRGQRSTRPGGLLPQHPERRLPNADGQDAGRRGLRVLLRTDRRREDPRAQRELQRPLQPGDHVLQQHERLGTEAHRRSHCVRAQPGRDRISARPHHERDRGQHLTGPRRQGVGVDRHRGETRRNDRRANTVRARSLRSAQARRQGPDPLPNSARTSPATRSRAARSRCLAAMASTQPSWRRSRPGWSPKKRSWN